MHRFVLIVMTLMSPSIANADLFINEIDYDNAGADTVEWIEIVGTAGTSLSNYELAFYNGAAGNPTPNTPYVTYDLAPASFTFANETNGWGFFVVGLSAATFGVTPDFTPGGWVSDEIQNGAPDGVQLRLKAPVTNVHLIEYEGDHASIPHDQTTLLADNSTDVRTTLYLTGLGDGFSDFTFANVVNSGTPGALNLGQTLTALAAVPEASPLLFGGMICSALGLTIGYRKLRARSAA
jgi:uncharacterized protein